VTIKLKIQASCSLFNAFSAWIDLAVLKQWLVINADIVPKKGGRYWLMINSPDFYAINPKPCRIVIFEPYTCLKFTWKGPEQFGDFMNFPELLTEITVIFSNISSLEKTEIFLEHSGWKSSEDWQKARIWHIEFWTNALNKLKSVLEHHSPSN
jgi:uncharacterized protein YndB with AHSA1/START domain